MKNKKLLIEIYKKIQALTALGERQGATEVIARKMIQAWLNDCGTPFTVQKFTTKIPKVERVKLFADGRAINAKATSFVSGRIKGKFNLVSSLMSSQLALYTPNINFNPACEAISRSNHYFAPSLAISKKSLPLLLSAKKINGEVLVRPYRFESANILIGNVKDPINLIFCHYDSISSGAVDNASGVVLSLLLIEKFPDLLENSLFVIAGNEELSYDQPIYWGRGYRAFERQYLGLFTNARKIFVLDCIGQTKTLFSKNRRIIELAFPINSLGIYRKKITLVCGEFEELMKIYHSEIDLPNQISADELVRSARLVYNQLKGKTYGAT